MFGASVDPAGLQARLATMISLATPHAGASDDLAFAVRLAPAESILGSRPGRVRDPHRRHVSLRPRGLVPIVIDPDFVVSCRSLAASNGDIAAEFATRVLNDVRALPNRWAATGPEAAPQP